MGLTPDEINRRNEEKLRHAHECQREVPNKMRWVERRAERVLQMAVTCTYCGDVTWQDIPITVEE